MTQRVLDLGLPDTTTTAVSGRVQVTGSSVVVNLSDRPAVVAGAVPGLIPPGQSTILREVAVEGDHLVLVEEPGELAPDAVRARGWQSFYGDAAAVVLLRGPQRRLGVREVDLGAFAGAPGSGVGHYDVRVNLWFAPAGTRCGVHDRHDFFEFHTQVAGCGEMQKFHAQDDQHPYERQVLAPGGTGAAPFCPPAAGGWVYPWHQYTAHSPSTWLAVEYHAVGAAASTTT